MTVLTKCTRNESRHQVYEVLLHQFFLGAVWKKISAPFAVSTPHGSRKEGGLFQTILWAIPRNHASQDNGDTQINSSQVNTLLELVLDILYALTHLIFKITL